MNYSSMVCAGLVACVCAQPPVSVSSYADLIKKYTDKKIEHASLDFNLTLLNFAGWTFADVIFNQGSSGNTNFMAAVFQGNDPLRVIFNGRFQQTVFQKATITNVTFNDQVIDSNFSEAKLENVKFRSGIADCNFENAFLKNVKFGGDFSGNFAGVELVNCTNAQDELLVVQHGKLVKAGADSKK